MKDLKRITRLAKTILTAKEIKSLNNANERAEYQKNEIYFFFFRELINTSRFGVNTMEWYLNASDELLLETLQSVKENKKSVFNILEAV